MLLESSSWRASSGFSGPLPTKSSPIFLHARGLESLGEVFALFLFQLCSTKKRTNCKVRNFPIQSTFKIKRVVRYGILKISSRRFGKISKYLLNCSNSVHKSKFMQIHTVRTFSPFFSGMYPAGRWRHRKRDIRANALATIGKKV